MGGVEFEYCMFGDVNVFVWYDVQYQCVGGQVGIVDYYLFVVVVYFFEQVEEGVDLFVWGLYDVDVCCGGGDGQQCGCNYQVFELGLV